MSSLAVFVPGAAPTARRSARLRCRASGDASGSAAASVRVFTGGSREARLGATQNMLALLETRGALDDAAIEASVEELSGMNPTPEPARARALRHVAPGVEQAGGEREPVPEALRRARGG